MKTLLTILLMTFAIVSYSQSVDSVQTTNKRQKPKATYKVGPAQVTVWVNKKSDGTTWKTFKVEKLYKKGDKWLTTNYFDERELLELKAALDKAISEEAVKSK